MVILTPCQDLICLDDLAARIRGSSNFQFAWRFFETRGLDLESAQDIRQALDRIIASPPLHEFLRSSFPPIYHGSFSIEPLHEHCRVVITEDFENVLARASNNNLGAYSPILRDAEISEKAEINKLFSTLDRYRPFQLLPGKVPGCVDCRPNSHIFSTWFYSVVWDWCFLVSWPSWGILWVACLTDTD